MVSAIVLVEHEPQATEADKPVSKTDRNLRQADSGRRFQAGETKEENPGRRCQAGGLRQVDQGRWTKVGGPRQVERKAGRQVLCRRCR